jgi:hypothetical protein
MHTTGGTICTKRTSAVNNPDVLHSACGASAGVDRPPLESRVQGDAHSPFVHDPGGSVPSPGGRRNSVASKLLAAGRGGRSPRWSTPSKKMKIFNFSQEKNNRNDNRMELAR